MLYDKRWDLDATSRALLAAAAYIQVHGWCRYVAEDRAGSVCIAGAILKITGVSPELQPALTRVSQLLDCAHIGHWNDRECKDKNEAIAVLQCAAFSQFR